MATSLAAIGIIARRRRCLVRLPRRAEARRGGARRAPGRRRAPSAAPRCSSASQNRTLSLLFALLAGGHRREAARLMDIALAIGLGLLAGVVAGLFGVGGGILFVPTLDARARADADPRRGDVAARDPADRGRGHVAAAAVRQRPLAAARDHRAGGDRRRRGRRRARRGAARARPAQALRRACCRGRRANRLAGQAASPMPFGDGRAEDVWIPLVDEPIGRIVARDRGRTTPRSARSSTRRASCSRSARSPTSASGSCSASCWSTTTRSRTTARRPGSSR